MKKTRFEAIAGAYEMAASILVYGFSSEAENIADNRYMGDYVLQLGRNTVNRIGLIVADSIESIQGGFTDSEGCEYRSAKFKQGAIWYIDL